MTISGLRGAVCVALAGLFSATLASAATLYDESIDGDLSNDASVYTEIQVQEGTHEVIAQTGPLDSDVEDYFELVLGELTLVSIELVSFDPGADNSGGTRFGSCLGPGDACQPGQSIAEILMTPADEGADLLALLETQAPGQLTNFFRLGESTGPSTTVLAIVAVPEPSAPTLLAAGAAILVGVRVSRAGRSTRGRPNTPR